MRLEMLQVARLSPNLLGESATLVEAFVRSQQHPDGGFLDLNGEPDLYYTVFAQNALAALQATLPPDRAEALVAYLDQFQMVAKLDFVHLCCLARALASLPPEAFPPDDPRRDRIATQLNKHRSKDGGFEAEQLAKTGSVYGCFLALGAHQDLGRTLPAPDGLLACIDALRTPDGAYANDARITMGTTPATAAALEIKRQLHSPATLEEGTWLLSQMHPDGGFYAMPAAPIPDLLTTATVLHALGGIAPSTGISIDPIRDPCLDFIDTLWTNRGGFHGNWMEETIDVEYTFYGLLALGHLSL